MSAVAPADDKAVRKWRLFFINCMVAHLSPRGITQARPPAWISLSARA
jgi:hypothetical protein